MAKLLSLKIDVKKISKHKLYVGQKGTYLGVTISLNDEIDQYGNNVSMWEELTAEERAAKVPKIFLGNGKVFWDSNGAQEQRNAPAPQQGQQPQEIDEILPF